MNLIAAADLNWGIGKDGGLLISLPGDMKYFKEKTSGKVVIMGRATLESLPGGKPLPNRTNIVLTTNKDFEREGCIIVHDMDELAAACAGYAPDDIMAAASRFTCSSSGSATSSTSRKSSRNLRRTST